MRLLNIDRLLLAVSSVPVTPGRDHNRPAGNRDTVAPRRFPRLLAVEVPSRRRSSRIHSEIRALIRRMSREHPRVVRRAFNAVVNLMLEVVEKGVQKLFGLGNLDLIGDSFAGRKA